MLSVGDRALGAQGYVPPPFQPPIQCPPSDRVDGVANKIWMYLMTEIQTYLTKRCQLFQFPNEHDQARDSTF